MTVTAITQGVIKYRAIPCFGVMTGAALPGFITGMILWCLMTGATISGVSMIQRLGFPFCSIMTGATIAGVVFVIRPVFIMAGQAVRIGAVIHLGWQPLFRALMTIGAFLSIFILMLTVTVAGLAGLVTGTPRHPGLHA